MGDQMSTPNWTFNVDDLGQGIHRTLSEGIETRIFCGENVMLSVVRLEPHSAGELHSHPEEQWGFLLDGKCTRIQSGEEIEMQKGDFWCTPSNVLHGIRTAMLRRPLSTSSARHVMPIEPAVRVLAPDAQ